MAERAFIRFSDLDTARFGHRIARAFVRDAADVAAQRAFCSENAIAMAVTRCPAAALGAVHALEAGGARLMDTLVYAERPLTKADCAHASPNGVRALGAGHADEIERVALRAFHEYCGHFHADPRLPAECSDAAYGDWARRSLCDPEVATTVLGAFDGDRLVGFLTLRATDGGIEIPLNAVDPPAQGRGVYERLLHAAFPHASRDGFARIFSSTQIANVRVQRIWARNGFAPFDSRHTFHTWFDAPIRR